MITNFETFGDILEPEIGDYVICYGISPELNVFLSLNIGEIVKIGENYVDKKLYFVHYTHVPKRLKKYHFEGDDFAKNCKAFLEEEIKYLSKTKKDLEIYIDIKKYNV